MKISFYGAAQEVTGSCFLLEIGALRLLIDCGMFQGSKFADDRNHEPLPFDAKTIDAVLVTHAHVDHTGRIPKLVGAGFKGKIYATNPTVAFARIMWEDALEVMHYDLEKHGREPIFDEDDVRRASSHLNGVEYGRWYEMGEGLRVKWHDAGHILGSAFLEVEGAGQRIVFSGDLGNRDVPIVRTLASRPDCDLLVMESTYGAFAHEDPSERKEKLRTAILETVKQGGVVLIPAFALERVQEILYELNALVESNQIPKVPIFLDSPLAIRATKIFKDFPQYYDEDAARRFKIGDDFFDFPGLRATLTRDESRTINNVPAPKVIIAGAGMMTGGRIFHHLRRVLPDPRSTVLIVGFQSKGTLGRRLMDGEEIKIFGEPVDVRARVIKIGGYSAHADRGHLVEWARGESAPPSRIFLVHGEPEGQAVLAQDLRALGIIVEIPQYGSQYNLDSRI